MRASCRRGHGRRRMAFDHLHQVYRCPECGGALTPEAIIRTAPEAYRPQKSSIGAALQSMLDFELEGVIREDGSLFIEYPRPSLDPGDPIA